MKKYTLLKKFNAFNLKLLTRRRRDWSHKFARFKYMYKAKSFFALVEWTWRFFVNKKPNSNVLTALLQGSLSILNQDLAFMSFACIKQSVRN